METTQAIDLLRNIYIVYSNISNSVCKELNMQPLTFDALMFFAAGGDDCTAKDFSQRFGIKPNVVSFHINKLVKKGYLERLPDAGDRRKIRLECTEKARSVLDRVRAEKMKSAAVLREGMSESDIECCCKCLRIFSENMRKLGNIC